MFCWMMLVIKCTCVYSWNKRYTWRRWITFIMPIPHINVVQYSLLLRILMLKTFSTEDVLAEEADGQWDVSVRLFFSSRWPVDTSRGCVSVSSRCMANCMSPPPPPPPLLLLLLALIRRFHLMQWCNTAERGFTDWRCWKLLDMFDWMSR